ncbi:MAG: hypothetical protein IIA40_00770 [SAR324 cluster bacterium]|nr:hypothetical protein [SAR324 cluster bacterium]
MIEQNLAGFVQRRCRVLVRLAIAAVLSASMVGALPGARPARAQNEIFDLASFYQTDLRALAMGNAYGPVARGEGALLYNPAGLVQFDRDIKIDASLAVEGEQGDFFSDTVDQLTESPSPQEVKAYLSKYNGTSQFYRAQTFGNFVANLADINVGFGVGVMTQTRFEFVFTDANNDGYTFPDGNQDSLTLNQDELDINFLSFAFQIFDGQLLIGATAKSFTLTRESSTAFFDTINDIDLAGAVPDTYDASGFDLGFIWRLETLSFLRGQISVTALNVGGITLENQTNDPTKTLEVPATYNVGIAISPELPWSPVHLLLSVELEDATGAIKVRDPLDGLDHDRSTTQRLHAGAELGIWRTSTGNNVLNARVGSHRGRAAFGFELNLFSALRILYTQYGDNFGHEDAKELHEFEAVQISFGFGF